MSTTIRDQLAPHVEEGAVPGLVALLARGTDEVVVEALGRSAYDRPAPMRRDAVFRIASLTKPIAAATAMSLVDDGAIALDDPVDPWLPELAGRRVLRSLDAGLDDTVAAVRAITVRDLLTSTMGFGCIMAPPDTYPIQAAEAALELTTLGPPWPPCPLTSDEWIRRLGSLPLMEQPGEHWRYNTGLQVLGVLLERVAGRPLEHVMRDRIFDPLGMDDTGFHLRPHQRARLTAFYGTDPATGGPEVLDAPGHSWWDEPPAMPSAASWLLSTVDDLWAFARMILGGGVTAGGRVLSEQAVAAMTADQLSAGQRSEAELFVEADGSWGLGMRVPHAGSGAARSFNGYGWDGGTGTSWRTDPTRRLTGILLTQRAADSPEPAPLFRDFWTAVDRSG